MKVAGMFPKHEYVKNESTLVRETEQERNRRGREHVDKQLVCVRFSLDVGSSSGNMNAARCRNVMSGKAEWWHVGRELYELEGSPVGTMKPKFAAD